MLEPEMLWGSIRYPGDHNCPGIRVEIFGQIGGWFVVGLGFGGLMVCVLDEKLGKMRSNLMGHGCRRRHMAVIVMGPHPRQQSTQQSTNFMCDGSTSLKLEKLFIASNMTINAHRVDVDEQQQLCSNATMGAMQPAG